RDFRENAAQNTLINHGQALHKMLQDVFNPDWDRLVLLDWQPSHDKGCKIQFEVTDSNLRNIPWELMARGNNWLNQKLSITRSHKMDYESAGPAADWPVRILILVGDPKVEADDEI